uniref:C-type lectin domain-containing protein n=1 Tax=Gouania willdenowi TaxID=441366 RepID=A0A8C5G776_GOUWI
RPTLCVCVCVCARVCDDCIKVDGTMSTAVGPEQVTFAKNILETSTPLPHPPSSWIFARDWCKEQGGTLAIIDNQHENSELILLPVFSQYLRLPTWIGLSDLLVENQYAWSDGVSPVLFTNWNDKEPNNAGGSVRKSQGCVSLHGAFPFHGTWNDTKCDLAKPYICKITYGMKKI